MTALVWGEAECEVNEILSPHMCFLCQVAFLDFLRQKAFVFLPQSCCPLPPACWDLLSEESPQGFMASCVLQILIEWMWEPGMSYLDAW
jgi:hypothetical protein